MSALRLHPEAERELFEIAGRCEAARPGYGARFENEVARVIELATAAPMGGTAWPGGRVRTWPTRRFPYVVAYVPGSPLVILAIAHTKRRPGYWTDRVP